MAARPQDLHSLLAWSTANSAPSDGTTRAVAAAPQPLDPGLIDVILGKTDAVRMRECVATVGDMSQPIDVRMTAWDELEMILESLDNANDLQPLGLWPKIVAHLTSSEDETVVQSLWVCGTAINNNPKAKDDFLRQDPLPTLVHLPRSSTSNQDIRSKALYCLGGVLKHDLATLERFTALDGWTALEDSLRDPSLPCRRKSAFLIASLLVDEVTCSFSREAALEKAAIVPQLVASLSPATAQPTGPNGDGDGFDEDVAESAVRALRAIGVAALSPDDRAHLVKALRDAGEESTFGLSQDEKAAFVHELAS